MGRVRYLYFVSFYFLLKFGVLKEAVAADRRPQEPGVKTKFPSIFGKSAIRRIIEGNGYIYENYTITTEDGYFLNLNRIVHPNRTRADHGYPLLLVNGYFMQSEAWLVQTRMDSNLGFVWSDHGYDVWLGDQRGTIRSKGHVNLSLEDPKFWDFSYHETGLYDLPAFIDFILGKTGYNDLIYSCISLGCTFHAVTASKVPSYNQKIRGAVYFVPVINNARVLDRMNSLQRLFWRLIPTLVEIFAKEYNDWFPYLGNLKKEIYYTCKPLLAIPGLMTLGKKISFGSNFHIPNENMCMISAMSVGGGSPKTTRHLLQNFQPGGFAEYDYRREENLKKYGTEWPPLYNMSKITSPIAIYYSDADTFTDPEVIEKTAKSFGGPVYTCKLPGFNHLDVAGGTTFRYVLPDAIDLMDSLTGYNNLTEKFKSGTCPSLEWIRHLQ